MFRRFRSSRLSAALLLVALSGAACARAEADALMAPTVAKAWLDGQGAQSILIDTRTAGEHAAGVIPGTDLLADWSAGPAAFSRALAGVPKDAPIVIYCRSGNRSGQAAEWMRRNGYSDVRDVRGGMIAWLDARLPVVRP